MTSAIPERETAVPRGRIWIDLLLYPGHTLPTAAATAVWFVAAALCGPYLAGVVGWPTVVLLGLVGSIAAAGYAGGPLAYARIGVADPIFFAMFALVAVPAAYVVQAAAPAGTQHTVANAWQLVPRHAFIVGLPVGALITNVLLIDEIRDVEFDRAKGWRSGAVRFGRAWSRAEIALLTLVAYLIPVWLWLGLGFGAWVLRPLITLPFAVLVARRVARSDRFEELFPTTPQASRLAMQFSALLRPGLALS